MASDMFLKIEGKSGPVMGESADKKHKDEIEISSFSWGESNAGFQGGSGGGAGKVNFQDLHFTANVNKSSPHLALHCATGEHLKTATLVARKQGGDQQEFYKVTLTDVIVSSFQSGGHDGSGVVPVDQFSLMPMKIEWEYSPQKADGTLDKAIKFGWDIKQNIKV